MNKPIAVISITVNPQTPMQFYMWRDYINAMRSIQMTEGTGVLADIQWPGFEVMMPVYTKVKKEVR